MNDNEKQSLKENKSFDELCEMYSNQPSIIQSLKKFHEIWDEAQLWQNINITWGEMDIKPEKMGTNWDFDCILDDIKSGTILDCFCGSGTTIFVGEKYNLSGIGIDTDEMYINHCNQFYQNKNQK